MMHSSARRLVRAACLAATLAFNAQAQDAQGVQALRLRSLAATCAPCHGTDGHAVAGAALPGLAGMPAGYFSEQMSGFKSGARPATVMTQLARGFSAAQIEQMARFFAAQPK
jgi:sulfide dehydrogenase cytochrome subunit